MKEKMKDFEPKVSELAVAEFSIKYRNQARVDTKSEATGLILRYVSRILHQNEIIHFNS
jgi:hypothetical protein